MVNPMKELRMNRGMKSLLTVLTLIVAILLLKQFADDRKVKVGQKYHKALAIETFNSCWNLIEKTNRTDEENEQMRRLAEVSLYHWKKVDNCTPKNLAIGYWLLARVYALSGIEESALYYADKCLQISKENNLEPYYIGYAHEARARALAVAEKYDEITNEIALARKYAQEVENPDDREYLMNDLNQIQETRK